MPFGNDRSQRDRRFNVAVVFSFLLIAESLAGVLMIATASAPDPAWGMATAFGVFFAIGLVPIWLMRNANKSPWAFPSRGGRWKSFVAWLRGRDGDRTSKRKVWKRKRTTFTPQPFGSDRESVFQPESIHEPQETNRTRFPSP